MFQNAHKSFFYICLYVLFIYLNIFLLHWKFVLDTYHPVPNNTFLINSLPLIQDPFRSHSYRTHYAVFHIHVLNIV